MSYAVVTLKKGEGRTLKAGGAWVFDNEIESITGGGMRGTDDGESVQEGTSEDQGDDWNSYRGAK